MNNNNAFNQGNAWSTGTFGGAVLDNEVCDTMFNRTMKAVKNGSFSFMQIESSVDRFESSVDLYIEYEYARSCLQIIRQEYEEIAINSTVVNIQDEFREILGNSATDNQENTEQSLLADFKKLRGYVFFQSKQENPNMSFVLSQRVCKLIEKGIGEEYPEQALAVLEAFYEHSPSLKKDNTSYECGAVAEDLFRACNSVKVNTPEEAVRLLHLASGIANTMEGSRHYLDIPEFKLQKYNDMIMEQAEDGQWMIKFPENEDVALAYIGATQREVDKMMAEGASSYVLDETLEQYKVIRDLYPSLAGGLDKYFLEEEIQEGTQDEVQDEVQEDTQEEVQDSEQENSQVWNE